MTERRSRRAISSRISADGADGRLARRPRELGRLVRGTTVVEHDDVACVQVGEHPAGGLLGRDVPVAGHSGEPHLPAGEVAHRRAHPLVRAEERRAPAVDRAPGDLGEQADVRRISSAMVASSICWRSACVQVWFPTSWPASTQPAHDAAPLVGRDRLADREERPTAAVALERLRDRLGPRAGPSSKVSATT